MLLCGDSDAVTLVQGVCFHLYSKARSSGLAEYQLPELQRSPLDELSLQVRPWPRTHACMRSTCSGSQGRLGCAGCEQCGPRHTSLHDDMKDPLASVKDRVCNHAE